MSAIVPTDKTSVVVRFAMYISDLVVNTSAIFKVVSFNIKDEPIETVYITLEGEDYTNWGSNDDYVTQYIANKMGYVLA
jgi:hypothetical protein